MARHISYLNIEAFRGIKNLELTDLGDINIIVGENNCGKTTVLETIKGLSVPLEIGNWLSASRKRESVFGSMSSYNSLNSMFNVNDENKVIRVSGVISNEKIEIEITGNEEVILMAKSEIEDAGYKKRSNRTSRSDKLAINEINNEKQEEVKAINVQIKLNGGKVEKDIAIEKIYEITRQIRISEKESKRTINMTYIAPFEHTFSTLYLKEVLENAELYAEMIKIAQIFDKNIIAINSFTENMEQVFKITSASNKNALPLAVYGDGMKKALLLISAIIKSKNGILLLDEMETAIHASAISDVFNVLLLACKKFNVQLFATTHSLEALDKLLNGGKNINAIEDMRIITLVKKDTQTVARVLNGEKAMQVRRDYDMELR